LFKTEQAELLVEVSTQADIPDILHSNFISYVGYLCDPESNSNGRLIGRNAVT